jgi:hypothetical protein
MNIVHPNLFILNALCDNILALYFILNITFFLENY